MRNIIAPIALACIALVACDKEDRLRQKYSGLYTVNSYEETWYANDSVVTRSDYGTMGMYDNDNNPYNNTVFQFGTWPTSWDIHDVGGGLHDMAVGWYTDDVDGNTLTFFSQDDFGLYWATYTVEHDGGKDYTWTYVATNADNAIAYREVWKVTRQ